MLIGLLAIPVLLIPAGIYAGIWLSKEILEVDYWVTKIKKQEIKLSSIKVVTCIILVFVLVLVWGIRGHSDKKMYAQYISRQVSNDYLNLARYILRNNTVYDEILNTDHINNSHLTYLVDSNQFIAMRYQYYRNLAIKFDKVKVDELDNSITIEVMDISHFFNRLMADYTEEHSQLKASDREKIELIKQLNDSWVDTIINNIKGTSRIATDGDYVDCDYYQRMYWGRAVLDDYWITVLLQINDETKKFIQRNALYDGRWLQR